MTPIEKILESIVLNWKLDLSILGKAGVILFLVIYFLFTLVVMRQVELMSRTLMGSLEKTLKLAAKLLTGLGLLAIVVALIVL